MHLVDTTGSLIVSSPCRRAPGNVADRETRSERSSKHLVAYIIRTISRVDVETTSAEQGYNKTFGVNRQPTGIGGSLT
jgi:hypothetical protein